jgi:hypothetical protein
MARRREAGHVGARLGEDLLRGRDADAGDLIELGHLGGERGDGLLDPDRERIDLGGERVDAVNHHAQQERVMLGEVPGQRWRRTLVLAHILLRAGPPARAGGVRR